MSHQATLNGDMPSTHHSSPSRMGEVNAGKEVASNLASFVHDLVSLSELQMALFSKDAREFTGKSIFPIVAIVVAAGLAVGTLPVALVAIAYFMSSAFGWTLASSLGVAAGGGLLIALVAIIVGGLLLKKNLAILTRSQYELRRNIGWIKESLLQSRGRA